MARRPQEQVRALVGAATRLRMDDQKLVKRQVGKRQAWQPDAWDMFDLVPEVKQSTWLAGNAMAKLRLFVAVDNPEDPDGQPIPVTDEGSGVPVEVVARAVAELDRLRGPVGGQGEILRALNMNLEVAGEGWLIGRSARAAVVDERTGDEKPAQPESWTVHAAELVDAKTMRLPDGRKSTITLREDADDRRGTPLDPDLDTAIRFWQRHPRYANRADCALRGCLDDCDTLVILKRQLRAEAKSHVPAGALFVDSNLKWIPMDPTQDNDPASNPLVQMISEALTAPTEDESHPASLAPLVGTIPLTGPTDSVQNHVYRMTFERSSESTLDERIKARVDTLARGLNMPFEKITGHQQTTFANAAVIDRDEWDDHYQPRAVLIVDLLTVGFLRPQLQARDEPDDGELITEIPPTGQDPVEAVPDEWVERLYVWFDESGVVRQPNREQSADKGYELGTVSDDAWRGAKGYSEDDAPSDDERLLRTALLRGTFSPEMTLAILRRAGVELDVQPLPGAQAVQLPRRVLDAFAHVASTPALTAASGDTLGREMLDVDRELRSRVLVLADRTVTRALEHAGAVLRSRTPAARAVLKGVPNRMVAATMGQSMVAASNVDVDQQIRDTLDGMRPQFMEWGAGAQRDALELASRAAGGFTIDERDLLMLRQAEDLAEAWGWLEDTLVSLTHARLFDPSSVVVQLGEFDEALSVPTGVIRQALVRAGGIAGVQTGGIGDAWLCLADSGRRPAGMIATGERLRGVMADHGVGVPSYVWVYGPAFRSQPFEPHLALNGRTFENFDDPALANPGPWPPVAFYMPGDHDGCICDFEPVLSGVAGGGVVSNPTTTAGG